MSDEEFDQLWTSCDWRQEIDQLRAENKQLTEELNEQARLLGISAERELALSAKVGYLEMERDRLMKGEYICKRCGLRKDNEHLTPDFERKAK